jgi:recombinational DNA repair protein RecR
MKFGNAIKENMKYKRKLTNPKSRGNWGVGINICKICGSLTENEDKICNKCIKEGKDEPGRQKKD